MLGCTMQKIHGNKISITSKDSTIMRSHALPTYSGKELRMNVLVFLIVMLRELLVSVNFRIPTLLFIQ